MRRHHRAYLEMREDPHAGKVPGLGCGCALCKQAIPFAAPMSVIEAQMAQDRYVSERAAWNAEIGMPTPDNRARAPRREA